FAAVLQSACERPLRACAIGAGIVENVLDSLAWKGLLELGHDFALLVTVFSSKVLVDLLRAPFVLTAIPLGEIAEELAEDRAGDEWDVGGPVAELAHHVLIVGDHVPREILPAVLLRDRLQRGISRGDQIAVRDLLE